MLTSCSTSCIPEREPESVEPVLQHIDTDHFELFLFNHWNKKDIPHIFSGYPFYSVHGSKYLCFVLEEDSHKGLTLLKEDIQIAYKVEASTLVLHTYNSLNDTPNLDRVVKTLVDTQKFAEEHSVSMSLELIPHVTLSIPELAAFLDSHLEKTFFTIDLEYTSKYKCLTDVLTHINRVNNIHVRDYDGRWVVNGKRRYLKPLDGTLDFDSIFSTITQSGYDGTYTLEAPHKTAEEINFSMRWLKTSLKTHISL
ncbi:MAG: sugar phosphate isomerase/epimerase [Theionarchaea archaeon]|nr:sugar phosphate isomerase/epimerase [Theionarchaea archaeon]